MADGNSLIHKRCNMLWEWACLRWIQAKTNYAVLSQVKNSRLLFENLRFRVVQAADDWNHLAFHQRYRANVCEVIRNVFLTLKLRLLCKPVVGFWSKLPDRQKINVKCWEPQWLAALLQISCCSTSVLFFFFFSFPSFEPWAQHVFLFPFRPIPVAFLLASCMFAHLLFWSICCFWQQ